MPGNQQMKEIDDVFKEVRDFFNDDPLFDMQHNLTDFFFMQSNSQENYNNYDDYESLPLTHLNSISSTAIPYSMEAEPEEPQSVQSTQESSTSQNSKKISKAERLHLKRERRKRGQKNGIQASVDGYWTKNFLQYGKKVHICELEKYFRDNWFAQNPQLNKIRLKDGITMSDYLVLYTHPDLQQFWKRFFARKTLYRGLMFSRVQAKFRKIFVKFIYRYEEAFKTKIFDHIADRASNTI